ncbi:MAG: hypothetical protein ACKVTZ_00435 [Bacteroidia bacterium]
MSYLYQKWDSLALAGVEIRMGIYVYEERNNDFGHGYIGPEDDGRNEYSRYGIYWIKKKDSIVGCYQENTTFNVLHDTTQKSLNLDKMVLSNVYANSTRWTVGDMIYMKDLGICSCLLRRDKGDYHYLSFSKKGKLSISAIVGHLGRIRTLSIFPNSQYKFNQRIPYYHYTRINKNIFWAKGEVLTKEKLVSMMQNRS